MEKLNFQMSFFQYLLLNDPSEIILICWFGAQETFFIIIVENSYTATSFWKPWYSFIFPLSSKEKNVI